MVLVFILAVVSAVVCFLTRSVLWGLVVFAGTFVLVTAAGMVLATINGRRDRRKKT